MRSPLEQPVSVDVTKQPLSEKPSANEADFLSLDDLKPRGRWKNPKGEYIRIVKVDPPVYFDSETGQEVFLGSPEDLLSKLREGGYTAEPMPQEQEGEGSHSELKAQIVTLDTEIGGALESIDQKRKALVAVLAKAQAEAEKTDSQAIAQRLKDIEDQVVQELEKVDQLSEQDDALDAVLQEKKPTLEDVKAKQSRREFLEETLRSFDSLTQEVQGFVDTLTSLAQERNKGEERSVASTGSSEKGSDAGRKGQPKRGRGGSGNDGGDGEDENERRERKEAQREARRNKREASQGSEPGGSIDDRAQAALLRARESARPAAPEVPSEEAPEASENWREELEKFLKRPEGREVIGMYRTILTEEWRKFLEMLDKAKVKLSLSQKIDLWDRDPRLFSQVRNRILRDLQEKRKISVDEAEAILEAVLRGLDEKFQQKMAKQRN
jgi:hypothetical protein